jgi:hypothetical protein
LLFATLLSCPAFAEDLATATDTPPEPEEDPIADLEAADAMPPSGYIPGQREELGVGLSPLAPEGASVLPGGVAPAFGAPYRPAPGKLQFRGYLQAGIRAGFGERPDPVDGQSGLTIHGDPVVPGEFGYFESTNTVQNPWTELNFSYATSHLVATVQIGAWGLSESMESAGYFKAPSQSWINDAYLTYLPAPFGKLSLTARLGVFPDRYGAMAKFSDGQYGASLIASIYGVGETVTAKYKFSQSFSLELEQGLKGDLNRVPFDLIPRQDNDYASPEQGSTFAHHYHLGADFGGVARPALHYVGSFSRDDLSDRSVVATSEDQRIPDGTLDIFGADVRVEAGRFGYLYFGGSYSKATDTISLGDLVQVLNTGGGKNFIQRFFGPASGGNGSISLVGGQYTVSLGTLLRYPDDFWGEGPDLQLSFFGLYGYFTSDDQSTYPSSSRKQYDGVHKFKLGFEATYSLLEWLAASGRVDYAQPDTRDIDQSFGVLTGKAIFRTGWQTSEALTLQYSRFINGSLVVPQGSNGEPKGDSRYANTTSGKYDEHVLALYGTIWW